MKALFIALAMFAANNALAARDCTPYVDPTTANETGTTEWIYPCGYNYTVEHRGCTEGEISYSNELDPTGSFYQDVTLVCHNGSFAPKAAPVKHRGCTEGEISYSNELDPTGSFYQDVTLVCHHGRYVRR